MIGADAIGADAIGAVLVVLVVWPVLLHISWLSALYHIYYGNFMASDQPLLTSIGHLNLAGRADSQSP